MYTIFVQKTVQPEYGIVYYFHNEAVWIILKKECADYCMYSFFHGSDVPLYFWYMFIPTGDVQHNSHFSIYFLVCSNSLYPSICCILKPFE